MYYVLCIISLLITILNEYFNGNDFSIFLTIYKYYNIRINKLL